jgi:fructose/tagatose bisphosphate aldolase
MTIREEWQKVRPRCPAYDPRAYLALAETAMAERVKQAASDLRASGKTTFAS